GPAAAAFGTEMRQRSCWLLLPRRHGDQFRPLGLEVGCNEAELVHVVNVHICHLEQDAHASFLVRKSRITSAISLAWVSSAKWPVSKNRTSALRLSRLNASAPDGRKNGSFLPHTASSGGWCVRKYSWNFG